MKKFVELCTEYVIYLFFGCYKMSEEDGQRKYDYMYLLKKKKGKEEEDRRCPGTLK